MIINKGQGKCVELICVVEDKTGKVKEVGGYCEDIKGLIAIRDAYCSYFWVDKAYIVKRTIKHDFVSEKELKILVDKIK